MNPGNKILILLAHPALHKSRVNSKLIKSVENTDNIMVHDLYQYYPDFDIDVSQEQQLLMQHDIIVWQHPLYWYSAPALLKEWIDRVLQHNFAYGEKGTALKGKTIFSALTAAGKYEAYQPKGRNRFSIRELLTPFEQTAGLCKMIYLPPYVVHGTQQMESSDILKAANNYKHLLISLRDNVYNTSDALQYEYLNKLLKA